jgi:hypothetical protein
MTSTQPGSGAYSAEIEPGVDEPCQVCKATMLGTRLLHQPNCEEARYTRAEAVERLRAYGLAGRAAEDALAAADKTAQQVQVAAQTGTDRAAAEMTVIRQMDDLYSVRVDAIDLPVRRVPRAAGEAAWSGVGPDGHRMSGVRIMDIRAEAATWYHTDRLFFRVPQEPGVATAQA